MSENQDDKNSKWEVLFQILESARKLGFGYCIGAGMCGLIAIVLSVLFSKFVSLQSYIIPISLLGGLLGLGLHKFTEKLINSLIYPIADYLKFRTQLWRIDGYEKRGLISKTEANRMRKEAILEYEKLNPKKSAKKIIDIDRKKEQFLFE